MLTLTQTHIDTILDLVEEYSNSRVEALAAADYKQRMLARSNTVARYCDLKEYLNDILVVQTSPTIGSVEPHHREFKGIDQFCNDPHPFR